MVKMTYLEPYISINCFDLSEVTLSFVEWCVRFGNGTNSSFASPKMSGLSVTHSGCGHPLLPDMHPRNHKSNIPFIPQRSSLSKLQRIQVISAKESGVIFFNIYIREKKEVHSASLKSCKLWSSNKTKFHPNGMPPISSSPDIPSFIRPEFG